MQEKKKRGDGPDYDRPGTFSIYATRPERAVRPTRPDPATSRNPSGHKIYQRLFAEGWSPTTPCPVPPPRVPDARRSPLSRFDLPRIRPKTIDTVRFHDHQVKEMFSLGVGVC